MLAVPGANSCAEAREMAADRLADVRAKLDDLAKLETVLADTIARCDAHCCVRPAPVCPVLEILEA
jgi:MerR family mercuric resistance operon transcriptional regulator